METWGLWGLHAAGANGGLPPVEFEPFDTHWTNGIMARHADDGRPLGHLHWDPDGEISSVTVHPDFQRRGVANAMLGHAQKFPGTYESTYPIRHSSNFSSAGRAWAKADPDYHDPGEGHVTKAEDDTSKWGYTAVNQYVPAHVPYRGQNEEEMAGSTWEESPFAHPDGWASRAPRPPHTASIQHTWPKRWQGNHPDIPWDKQWNPNHPQHVPGPWERTA